MKQASSVTDISVEYSFEKFELLYSCKKNKHNLAFLCNLEKTSILWYLMVLKITEVSSTLFSLFLSTIIYFFLLIFFLLLNVMG